MSSDDLIEFFSRYGWQYERRRTDLFRTGFVGDHGQFEIWVRFAEPWIYFTINPFVDKPAADDGDQAHGAPVLDLLLRANHALNMAKFALDNDGDLSLSVELPTEGFAYSQFADALTALSHYADAYRPLFEDASIAEVNEGEVV